MDLLIRAARNDHTMIEKLCAPASAGLWAPQRLPLSGLVADANVAGERPQLRTAAVAAGIPYLIDPVTPLLQHEQMPRPRPGVLNSVARAAERSVADARLANATLSEVGLKERLPEEDTFRALVRVSDELRKRSAEQVV